jgi:cytochrome c peroxidase
MMKKSIVTGLFFTVFFSGFAVAAPPAGLTDIEVLGRHLYKDKNLSFNGTQSCQVCHHPFAGFADLRNALHPEVSVVSVGADGVSKGGRNAPTSAYAGYSPILYKNSDDNWVGGMFWDGRATGGRLGDPLAEQAEGPPLNPLEMAMPDKEAVVTEIEGSTYATLFLKVFGPNAFDNIDNAYDNFARAVAAYERSREVTRFTSKYDTARSSFTESEQRGLKVFGDKCASCHSLKAEFGAPKSLFTNYQYRNVGLPSNPLVPLPDLDLGLGTTVRDSLQDGKFKIPTLRNVALSAPYGHNGFFPTLREMVSFINDRSGFTPEVGSNLDMTVGNIGLSTGDVDDLVAFLLTLTDV